MPAPWPNHPHDPPTRFETYAIRVLDRLPMALLTQAYELVVSLALVVIAIPVVAGQVEPTSIHAAVRPTMATIWGVTLLVGAALTVAGLLIPKRPRLEWSGQILMGISLLLYGIAVLNLAVPGSSVGGVVFTALGGLALWRAFKISFRNVIHERLARQLAEELVARAHRQNGTRA